MDSTTDLLSGHKLLITGINGFLGVHAGILALDMGASVIGVDLPGSMSHGEKIRSSLGGGRFPIREADLSSLEGWGSIIEDERPDAIIHLAATAGKVGAAEAWDKNIKGNFLTTWCLIQSLSSLSEEARPVVVYPGSQLEYGVTPMPWSEEAPCRPAGPYAASKLLSTDLILAVGRSGICKVCAARFPIVYGPAQPPRMFIPELICKSLAGVEFKMTEGRQRRRFTYVADGVSFLLTLAADLLKGTPLPSLINAPSAGPSSMREIAERIADDIDRSVKLSIGALPMRTNEVLESWPVASLAESLGYSYSVELDEGLRRTVEWYRSNSWYWEGLAC
jgi:nucleoside-diphosphate-sugar epimerase